MTFTKLKASLSISNINEKIGPQCERVGLCSFIPFGWSVVFKYYYLGVE